MAVPFDPAAVRALATILADTGLTEIEIESKEGRIRVARTPAPVTAVTTVAPAAVAPAAAAPIAAPDFRTTGPDLRGFRRCFDFERFVYPRGRFDPDSGDADNPMIPGRI